MDQNTQLFFEREQELERLLGLMEQALAGKSSICFVMGEPGAGKSTLLAEFAQQAKLRHSDLILAAGDCNPQTGSDEPYLPFREILADLTDEDAHKSGPDSVEHPSGRFLQAARRIVAEHGPDLVDIFIPGGALITRVGAQAAQKVRQRHQGAEKIDIAQAGIDQGHLFEQYTNVLCKLSSRAPLMLFIDDLHWADEASLNLLFHLSRRLDAEPVLLVGAYRPFNTSSGLGGDNRTALVARLSEIKRYQGDVWVDLDQIGRSRARALTEALIDAEPNRLDEAFRETLFHRTGGHALFSVELLRHLKGTGKLRKDRDDHWITTQDFSWEGLPARVEGIIAERAVALDDGERQILDAACTMGEAFLAEVVAEVVQRDSREVIRCLSDRLARTFDLIRAEGFERVRGGRVARYQFRHNLFQEYFYQQLDPVEKVLLHESIGQALESMGDSDTWGNAAQLAWHFEQAELPDKALKYRLQAGHEARGDYANAEALTQYRSALSLLEDDGGMELDPSNSLKTEILASMGHVLQLHGQPDAALNAFRQALALTPDSAQLARADLYRAIAGSFERLRQNDEAIEELARAAELLGSTGEGRSTDWWNTWIAITMDQVRIYYWAGKVKPMTALLDQLAGVIDQKGNAHQRCHFWTGQAMRGYRVDRFSPTDDTLVAAKNALAAAQEENSLLDLCGSLFGLGFAYMLRREPDRARPKLEEALFTARRCGDLHQEGRSLAYLLHTSRLAGDIEAVRTGLPEAEAAAETCDMQEYLGLADANRAWVAVKSGDMTAGDRLAHAALQRWQEHGPRYPLKWTALFPLLAAALALGKIDQALAPMNDLLDPIQAQLPADLETSLRTALEQFSAGKQDAGREIMSQSLDLARQHGFM